MINISKNNGSLTEISKNNGALVSIDKNSGNIIEIQKNMGTLSSISKNGAVSYLLTDLNERILVGVSETDELILVEANPLTNILKNV